LALLYILQNTFPHFGACLNRQAGNFLFPFKKIQILCILKVVPFRKAIPLMAETTRILIHKAIPTRMAWQTGFFILSNGNKNVERKWV